jgi:hypothetical protein
MRVVAAIVMVLVLGGCARVDEEIARVRAKISLRDLPKTASEEPAEPPAPCVGEYDVTFDEREHQMTRLGGVTFVDLRTSTSWRYATARAYVRHLRRDDPRRKEILDNGPDFHVARFAHVIVPATRVATISVAEPLNFSKIGLIPGGVSRFGGYSAIDGEPVLRCEAGPTATTFPLGIVVEGPGCASVTVQLDRGQPESRLIAFGRKQCP